MEHQNNTLEEEELDRELVALNHGHPYFACDRVKVGNKQLTFYQKIDNTHPDYSGHDTRLTFEKTYHCSKELLSFKVDWNSFEHEKCSLGHFHQKNKKANHHKAFSIEWEHVDQLIEWLQLGGWRKINNKPPREKALLEEAIKIMEEIAKSNAILKPICKKFIYKVNNT